MKNNKYYVTATDKFLSGWGLAKGKISKMVAVCDNWETAEDILARWNGRKYLKFVGIRSKKPYYPSANYHTVYKNSADCI
ncbi:MAG: hypothetical protein ACRC78_18310 [Planktothrix sp.]